RLGTFDLVIGNPPYRLAGKIDLAVRRARAAVVQTDWPELDARLVDGVARHADVAATCLLRALRLVRPGGRLAFVVSTALVDADAAAPLWEAIAKIASVRALVIAPSERWFADAAVNPMLVIADRVPARSGPRLLRLTAPTEVAAHAVGLDAIAAMCDERRADTPAQWGAALRAPAAWFAWRQAAAGAVVPLSELAAVRRGMTTGANRVFYLRRADATARRLEPAYLAPVVRSPFNGSPTAIAVAPDESPLVALALPPDLALSSVPRIAAWLDDHRGLAERTSVKRREPWWSLPFSRARLFVAKAYGPRFVQRLADVPMVADQRVYTVEPKPGVDLIALAAVLNSLPTALALESLGRASMGYGVVEHTVADANDLPVLDVRRADRSQIAALAAALAALSPRLVEHVKLERDRDDRRALDHHVMALAPGAELADAMWSGLIGSVALRDRYLLPAIPAAAD
ncbi:MAG TPA: hypothetical protein VGO00_21265, partial [Kofleriaceae bacterium]|nr:hypothetical protein [Kofleriaceae bacterium]